MRQTRTTVLIGFGWLLVAGGSGGALAEPPGLPPPETAKERANAAPEKGPDPPPVPGTSGTPAKDDPAKDDPAKDDPAKDDPSSDDPRTDDSSRGAEPPPGAIVPPSDAPPPPPEGTARAREALESARTGAGVDDVHRSVHRIRRAELLPAVLDALSHRDERVRKVACSLMARMRMKKEAVALTPLLADPDPGVVLAAAEAMRFLGDTKAMDQLAPLLYHQSARVRCGVAAVLGRVRSKKIGQLLESRARGAETPEERACVAEVLVRAGRKEMVSVAVDLLASEATRVLGTDLLRLAGARPSLAALGKALEGKPAEGFASAALGLAPSFGAEGLEWLAGLLRSGDVHVRRTALDILLRNTADKTAAALLTKAAGSGEPAVRARVIEALSAEKSRDIVEPARKWLRDPAPLVRAAAARVFAAMPSPADDDLLLRTYQIERMSPAPDNLAVRVHLLRAMGARKKADWIPVFVDACGQKGEQQAATDALVASGEPAVRTLLLVIKVGDMDRIPFAVEALARIGAGVGEAAKALFYHPRETIRELGRDLMAASGDPKAVGPLVELFRSEKVEDPVPLLQAIATFTTPEAKAALVQAAGHPNAGVRQAAVDGLGAGHYADAPVLGVIVKVAETDAAIPVRISAIRALFRVGAPGLAALLCKMLQYEGPEVRTVAAELLGWTGDPSAVPILAGRLRFASGKESEELETALFRLTRRDDLQSEGNYVAWHRELAASVAAQAKGATRGELDRKTAKLHYRVAGAGAAVLGIPGEQGGDALAPALLPLVSEGLKVVTYDPRGRGSSPLGTEAITLKSEVDDIEALRAALDLPQMSLVAHGHGALVAVVYARTYPKRVRSLVLVSPPAVGSQQAWVGSAARKLSSKAALDLANLDARHAWLAPYAWLRYRAFALAPGFVRDPLHAPRISAFPADPIASQWLGKAVAGLGLQRILALTQAPTTILVGDEAPLTSQELTEITKAGKELRHVAVTRLAGVGHYPHLENPGLLHPHLLRALAGR